MSTQTYDRQNPAFYALLIALVEMAIGPIYLMLVTSLKLNLCVMSDTSSLLFMPPLRNYETALCDFLWYEPEHLRRCGPTFGRALVNSLIIGLVSTAITLIIGTMAAMRCAAADTCSG